MSIPIYLVRHGEADAHWGQSADPGLSELGREQARKCAHLLAPRLDAGALLLTSPLARARQTAAPLARLLDADVLVSDVYREIPSSVPLSQRRDWLREFMREEWKDQADTLIAWREALLAGLYSLQSPVAIFTHFLVINTVVGHVRGNDLTLNFWPDNASVTEIMLTDGKLVVTALGREMETAVN